MGFIDKAKRFLRGGTGLKGPERTPPVHKKRVTPLDQRPDPRRMRNGGSRAKKVHATQVAMRMAKQRRRARANRGSKALRRARQVVRSKAS